jgi:molecular chaperone DnaK
VGSEKIGGDDIDLELARRVHPMFSEEEFDNMSAKNKDQIIMACEEAKIGFMNNDEWTLELKDYASSGYKTKNITYKWFKEVIEPIIRDRVVQTIYDTMGRAHKNPSAIDAVIIVGGSSNLRPFIQKVEEIFGKEKIIQPKEKENDSQWSQWSVAKGAAMMGFLNADFTLNDDVGILLSDDTIYPILKKDESHIGTKSGPISFKLIEDSQSANFVFVDAHKNRYAQQSIKTKGFLQENLCVNAEIDDDQIVEINISNSFMGGNYKEKVSIKKLNFYYDFNKTRRKGGES